MSRKYLFFTLFESFQFYKRFEAAQTQLFPLLPSTTCPTSKQCTRGRSKYILPSKHTGQLLHLSLTKSSNVPRNHALAAGNIIFCHIHRSHQVSATTTPVIKVTPWHQHEVRRNFLVFTQVQHLISMKFITSNSKPCSYISG